MTRFKRGYPIGGARYGKTRLMEEMEASLMEDDPVCSCAMTESSFFACPVHGENALQDPRPEEPEKNEASSNTYRSIDGEIYVHRDAYTSALERANRAEEMLVKRSAEIYKEAYLKAVQDTVNVFEDYMGSHEKPLNPYNEEYIEVSYEVRTRSSSTARDPLEAREDDADPSKFRRLSPEELYRNSVYRYGGHVQNPGDAFKGITDL